MTHFIKILEPFEDVWYDETEEDRLREKYEKSFKDPFDSLVFEERYIKYIGENI